MGWRLWWRISDQSVISVNNYRVVLEEILKLTHSGAALDGKGAESMVSVMISVNNYRAVLEEILKLKGNVDRHDIPLNSHLLSPEQQASRSVE